MNYMKHFFVTNWYRLIMSFSMLLIAFGFAVWSFKSNTAKAGEPVCGTKHTVQNMGLFEPGEAFTRLTITLEPTIIVQKAY